MSLDEAQARVADFHAKFGVPDRWSGIEEKTPLLCDEKLRAALIAEESGETVVAILRGDFPGAVDGLCDLIYVCLGAAVRWGVDLSPIFDAVHRANMAKDNGGTRGDGKVLKPPGWTPPDIAGLLKAQGWDGR